ncbi:glycosyltransferase [Demequina sp. SYSU T00068]|uniref:glycosyltransferase family 4 protein n=1 Tax=Demequina lignilytica TaxID=3051663 RepID=UPI00262CC54F|nr:glycosyltransferase [Demequina sp. SYSU T00068]MDN4490652.1 glycosyltransferase [Demequina sp. SYSU T00068]
MTAETASYGFYLAVLPAYRTNCMRILQEDFGGELRAWVSDAHLERTVTTDTSVNWYQFVRMHRLLGGRLFLQLGGLREAARIPVLVVDLNPRSLTAWWLLVARWLTRRRTLVWGHMHPQSGGDSGTAWLRRAMRRLADGAVSYTYGDSLRASNEVANRPIWVAPNALHTSQEMRFSSGTVRDSVIYVGRFSADKKVALLVEAFAEACERGLEATLLLVGDGPLRPNLQTLIAEANLSQAVEMPGWTNDAAHLRRYYDRAFVAVSPGFAGLGLTQALGFGVPMLVSRDESHSPEIELAEFGGVEFFESDSAGALASALERAYAARDEVPHANQSALVASRYSAEAMARGLADALRGNRRGEEQ